jgi:anti-sigma B factor antagonist
MVDHFADSANSAVSAHRHGFEVQESWSDRLVVLTVSGEVDILSAPQLTEAICGALGKTPAGVVVDLTEVSFLASVGMSILVAAQEAADAMSVPFGIIAEGAATSRPMRLLGIDAILVLYPTLCDASRDLRCGNEEPAPTQSP